MSYSTDDKKQLLTSVFVTAELAGATLSREAAAIMCDDLAAYPLQDVLAALTRVRRECRGRMTLADIIDRIDLGYPDANAAWAKCPRHESESTWWTDEQAVAFNAALPLIIAGDHGAARMAFKEAYDKAVGKARQEARRAVYKPSWGYDQRARIAATEQAIAEGLIKPDEAARRLPQHFAIASDGKLARVEHVRAADSQALMSVNKAVIAVLGKSKATQ